MKIFDCEFKKKFLVICLCGFMAKLIQILQSLSFWPTFLSKLPAHRAVMAALRSKLISQIKIQIRRHRAGDLSAQRGGIGVSG